jgi:hypothetical protein
MILYIVVLLLLRFGGWGLPKHKQTTEVSRDRKNYKHKPWLFSLCLKLRTDAVNGSNAPSLRHFLEAERRTASVYKRNQNPTIYGPSDFSPILPISNTNSLFVGGQCSIRWQWWKKIQQRIIRWKWEWAPLLFWC